MDPISIIFIILCFCCLCSCFGSIASVITGGGNLFDPSTWISTATKSLSTFTSIVPGLNLLKGGIPGPLSGIGAAAGLGGSIAGGASDAVDSINPF